MHNGVVSNFLDIRRDLSDMMSFDAYCNIFGTTDSEHVAALFVTNLTKGGTKDTWEQEHSLEDMLGIDGNCRTNPYAATSEAWCKGCA